jgi:hypothetical protein
MPSPTRPKGTPFIITYNNLLLSHPRDTDHLTQIIRVLLADILTAVRAEGGDPDKDTGKVKDKKIQADIDTLVNQIKEWESIIDEDYYPHMDSGDVDDLENAREDRADLLKRIFKIYDVLSTMKNRYDLIDSSSHAEGFGGGFGVIKDRE